MLWAVTLGPVVFDQKMDVVRRHHIIENRETEAFLGLQKPNAGNGGGCAQTSVEMRNLMAAVRNVPDVTRQKIAIGARHRLSLRPTISTQKSYG